MNDIFLLIDDKRVSEREANSLINSFWRFCHDNCCNEKEISFDDKIEWFKEMHNEHTKNDIITDMFEWEWKM